MKQILKALLNYRLIEQIKYYQQQSQNKQSKVCIKNSFVKQAAWRVYQKQLYKTKSLKTL